MTVRYTCRHHCVQGRQAARSRTSAARTLPQQRHQETRNAQAPGSKECPDSAPGWSLWPRACRRRSCRWHTQSHEGLRQQRRRTPGSAAGKAGGPDVNADAAPGGGGGAHSMAPGFLCLLRSPTGGLGAYTSATSTGKQQRQATAAMGTMRPSVRCTFQDSWSRVAAHRHGARHDLPQPCEVPQQHLAPQAAGGQHAARLGGCQPCDVVCVAGEAAQRGVCWRAEGGRARQGMEVRVRVSAHALCTCLRR